MFAQKTLVALGMVAMLAACGGGGGGGSANAGGGAGAGDGGAGTPVQESNPPVNSPAPIVVTSQTNQVLTAGDCPRITDDAASAAALDLTNPSVKAVSDLLLEIDPVHAYNVFTRLPNNFLNWVMMASGNTGKVDTQSLGTAVHETLHQVDTALSNCGPAGHKLQFFGNKVPTNLVAGDTPAYGIVAQTIAPALQAAPRYTEYIVNLGANAGNQFPQLLDELAAYTGGAWTELQYVEKIGEASQVGLDSNLGGMVNFMVYLQNYLQSARLNNNAQWLTIKNSPVAVAAIQTIWTRAETVLAASYAQTKAGAKPQLLYDAAYLNAAYSAGLLAELDQLGIPHKTAADWRTTYLP